MDVLVISQRKVLPAVDGGRIYSLGLLKYLKDCGTNTTFVSFVEEEDYSQAEKEELLALVSSLYTCPLRWKNTALNLSIKYPNNIRKYTRKKMFNQIKEIKQKKKYEVVIIDHLQMFEYASLFSKERLVLYTHNVESNVWLEYSQKCSGLMRYFVSRSARMTFKYEKEALIKADGVTAISEEDMDCFRNMAPGINGAVMPFYNKVERIKNKKDVLNCSNKIVFVGSYGWYPNRTAARFLALELMPMLNKRNKDLKLYIVGKDPTEEIKGYASNPNIIVTGTVDSIDSYIKNCDVFVNAVTEGGGVNIKMIEAMGKGIPIVTSEFGTRGIDIRDGVNALIYHTVEECACYVEMLLKDRVCAYELTEKARELYEQFIRPNKLVGKVIFGEELE